MRRWTSMAAPITAIAISAGLGPAAAAPFVHDQFDVEFDFVTETFCGDMSVRVEGDFQGTFTIMQKGREHLPHFQQNLHGTHRWTNLATGLAMTDVLNTIAKDQSVTDNGDGTITVRAAYTGHDALYGPDGRRIDQFGGTTWSVIILDHGGTLVDPDDDVLLSEEIVSDHGNGPDMDFCQAFVDATTPD
ncbi:MAG TPA: hypothetical protein VLI04_11665 [Nocardioidaceae bacterium]|nr:hypothetical protein [Nocardioidaceae bacterium]